MKRILIASFCSLGLATFHCGGLVSLEDHPCPCSAGYMCCAAENVCVTEGASCADLVHPDGGPPDEGGPDGAGGLPMDWGEAAVIPMVVGAPRAEMFVGSSVRDIWAGAQNRVWHWNGIAWRELPVPAPVSNGSITAYMASAGRGALWIASPNGIVRLDEAGGTTDFSAPVSPAASDTLTIQGSRDGATLAFFGSKHAAFQSSGGAFSPIAPLDGSWSGPSLRVLNPSSVWAFEDNLFAHYDGAAWSPVVSTTGYVGRSAVVLASGELWQLHADTAPDEGSVCPPWCHPGSPPYNAAITQPLLIDIYRTGAPVQSFTRAPPPDVSDGSVKYASTGVQLSARGLPAIVGCATTMDGTAHMTVHEVVDATNPSALSPRAFAAPVPCATPGFPPPLTDGTWIFFDQALTGLLVVRP